MTTSISYDTVMTSYYQAPRYFWDANAQAPYLSIDSSGSANDKFVSYEDERACTAKVSYARNRRLGGVMIWELAGGYRASQPIGQREPLLQAVKQAFATPQVTNAAISGTSFQIAFTAAPLGQYAVVWSSNLTSTTWTTLLTNTSSAGGSLLVTNTNALNQAQRFYRVQTPP